MSDPSHLHVRLDASDTLSVLSPDGAIPFADWAATSPSSVRILDLDLVPFPNPSASGCACGRPHASASTPSQALQPLASLSGLQIVRRWTPHSCAIPPARRVLNLDCTGLSGGGEGEEFRLEACVIAEHGMGQETEKEEPVTVYNGLWEYDEFPRFVVDGVLRGRVVLRVMAPGDEDESDDEVDGEAEEEGEADAEPEGEDEEEGEWEDEDEDEDDNDTAHDLDPAEAKIRALMARTKYLPLTAFIVQAAAAGTQFTLVDVEAWDEDEDGVEDKIRAELEKAIARRASDGKELKLADIVRFVSLADYRAEVGRVTFRLESANLPPWSDE